jgi:hypothetical protein
MDPLAGGLLRWRKPIYIALGILALAMFTLSLVQVWFLYAAPDPNAYGSIAPTNSGLPSDDQRGAFLALSPDHSAAYPTDLLQLLATSEAGVVDTEEGAHLKPSDLAEVLVQSANISAETSDYRVYIIGDQAEYPMSYTREPGGKVLRIKPQSGTWKPGAYIVDIPSEGMFGGRDYYQFYVDDPNATPTPKP